MPELGTTFEYSWTPFLLGGRHFIFNRDVLKRIERARSSHWGPAVYKWEGQLKEGTRSGMLGILIGETVDLRQRIRQYARGTQVNGNKYWREEFLTLGETALFILDFEWVTFREGPGESPVSRDEVLASKNLRLVLEQLLVQSVLRRGDKAVWLVNRNQ